MKILGAQLTATQYEAFKAAMATQLSGLRVQTINTGGKFAVNGRLTDEQAATIHGIYDAQRTAVTDSTFDMLAYQTQQMRNASAGRASAKMRGFFR